jgi:hypothetical protein
MCRAAAASEDLRQQATEPSDRRPRAALELADHLFEVVGDLPTVLFAKVSGCSFGLVHRSGSAGRPGVSEGWGSESNQTGRIQARSGGCHPHTRPADADSVTGTVLRTITTTHRPVTSLCFLLHKHPDRAQTFDVFFGAARSSSVADLRLAPFHVAAARSGAFVDREHTWHLERCDLLVAADPQWLTRTGRRVVDVTDADSQAADAAWCEQLTGGEGMVVKPLGFVARGRKGLVQLGARARPVRHVPRPIKCRGREYLRIVDGLEYADPSQIDRLRRRSLGRKRSLAVRAFALGVGALERFVRREPLHRVRESVFAVLAMEREFVDSRL